MICCPCDVKVIFTTSMFRIWGLYNVQKGVRGRMLQGDWAYCYIVIHPQVREFLEQIYTFFVISEQQLKSRQYSLEFISRLRLDYNYQIAC